MEEKKISLKEALSLNFRGIKDIQKICPKLFPSVIAYALVTAVSPYVTIFLSSQILTELTFQRRESVLLRWVIITVVCEGLLLLLNILLKEWRQVEGEDFYFRKEMLFSKKMFSMDYADVDKQSTHDLRTQILQNDNWQGWGLVMIPENIVEAFVKSVVGIISAVTLTVSLFTIPVPETAGALTALNNPIFIPVLFGLMVGFSLLSGFLYSKALSYMVGASKEATLGNRIFSYFGFIGNKKNRAADIRMYNQQNLVSAYWNGVSPFSCDGIFGKLTRGPMGILGGLSFSVSAIFTGFVYVFTCLKAWAGAFGVGSVTRYVGSVTTMSGNVSALIQMLGYIKANAGYLQTTYKFLDIPNSMYKGSLTTEKCSDRQYEVEFRNVSFKYPGSETWALKNVSIRFKVGSRLAIVGENGSGKTTFIKLLCRLYDPQEGQILLNGIDIRKYNYRDYMNIFSIVFQDFQLISQPLGANVAGSSTYDKERVTKALTDAGFGERLNSMPNGLDTQLYKDFTENGIEVSGGEAQKIAIARALYKDAPFIILDEPTAALDPIAEAEIYSKFNEISGDRTAIYISHRLSSCRFCDEIAVFHKGSIVQMGTHEQLVSDTKGKYYELWHAQAQYYTENNVA